MAFLVFTIISTFLDKLSMVRDVGRWHQNWIKCQLLLSLLVNISKMTKMVHECFSR